MFDIFSHLEFHTFAFLLWMSREESCTQIKEPELSIDHLRIHQIWRIRVQNMYVEFQQAQHHIHLRNHANTVYLSVLIILRSRTKIVRLSLLINTLHLLNTDKVSTILFSVFIKIKRAIQSEDLNDSSWKYIDKLRKMILSPDSWVS